MDKLGSCFRCKSKNIQYSDYGIGNKIIACLNCKLMSPWFKTKVDAFNWWNIRPGICSVCGTEIYEAEDYCICDACNAVVCDICFSITEVTLEGLCLNCERNKEL